MKKFPPLKYRLSLPDIDHRADKVKKGPLLVGDIPIQPGEFIVLTIGIVIALLRMADVVSGQNHRHTGGQEQGGDKVSFLLRTQRVDRRIIRRSFGPAIPAIIVVGAILIVFPIRFVIFVVVAHEIVERKSVVTGDEVDTGVRLPSLALVEVATAAQTSGELGEESSIAFPKPADVIPVDTVPLTP